jgi:hypothetical protein
MTRSGVSSGLPRSIAVAGWTRRLWWLGCVIGILGARAFLVSTATVLHWILILLIVLAGITVLYVLVVLIWVLSMRSPEKPSPPASWASYTSDDFFGLDWRWHYSIYGEVESLASFCPHCDFQLYPESMDRMDSSGGSYRFRCDNCARDLGIVHESPSSLRSKVVRSIQRNQRSGQWPGKGLAST